MSRVSYAGSCFRCVLFLFFPLFWLPIFLLKVSSGYGLIIPSVLWPYRWIFLYSVGVFCFCSPIFGKFRFDYCGVFHRAWVEMAIKQMFFQGIFFFCLFLLSIFPYIRLGTLDTFGSFFDQLFQGFICWIFLCFIVFLNLFFFRGFFLFGVLPGFSVLFNLPVSQLGFFEILVGSSLFFFGGALLGSTWNNLNRTRELRCNQPIGSP